jgi:hypothetical protein
VNRPEALRRFFAMTRVAARTDADDYNDLEFEDDMTREALELLGVPAEEIQQAYEDTAHVRTQDR